MADSLHELLQPHFSEFDSEVIPPSSTPAITHYLQRLSSLSLSALTSTEREALDYDVHTSLRSLQALAKRSFRSVNTAVESLQNLHQSLPQIASNVAAVHGAVPAVDLSSTTFAEKYSKASENPILDRRRQVMRLGTNIDKISDILELPSLLSTTIAASAGSVTGAGTTMSSANANYASALDLYAHIKRLQKLYPDFELVQSISVQAEEAMRGMTTNLITSLRSQSLKLAGGMRLIALLRRVAPELDDRQTIGKTVTSGAGEGSLGALFLISRLSNLFVTLEALEPLKDLAEQETAQRVSNNSKAADKGPWAAGQQTERYLKRYVEVFREQCFAIISIYKSIFPASLPEPANPDAPTPKTQLDNDARRPGLPPVRQPSSLLLSVEPQIPNDDLLQLPSALSTFTLFVVDMLIDELRMYLPNIRDQNSRDSLLTQVLYCATSLGRLGGDFGLMLSLLDDDSEGATDHGGDDTGDLLPDPEYVQIIQKHRIQAGRLELLSSGVGGGSRREAVLSPS